MRLKTHTPAPRARVAVAVIGWAVAMLLLAVVTVATVAETSGAFGSVGDWPRACAVGLAAVSLQAVVLIRTHTAPRLALVAVSAVAPVAAVAGLGAATGVTSVAVLIAAYMAVVDIQWPRPAASLASAAALVGFGDLIRGLRDGRWEVELLGTAVLQGAGTVGIAAVVGAMISSRREAARARVGRDVAVAREQAALSQAAVARERVAMARELHDIAAHHLSGIAVMTGALDRQIDSDPAGAKVAVRQVRQQSTAMLRDLRSLVALLRDDDPDRAALEPESLGGIPGLVDSARLAGRDVGLSVLGATVAQISSLGIGPLSQFAAYRTVQESLANVARHAPGARCEVVIDVRVPSEVAIVVRNGTPLVKPRRAPSAPGSGFGIIGMRERAELTDAQLSAGPTSEGGWVVRLTIPTETQGDPL